MTPFSSLYMSTNPLISFVLPAYKSTYFRQAITSILEQSFTDFELIIVDDCSPENLKSIVEEFADDRITYYRNAENIGGKNLVAQWNHCIQYAKGDYLVLAADDDIYDKEFLKECILLARQYPEMDVIHSRVATINEENEMIGIDGVVPQALSKHGFLYYWLQGAIVTCIGNYMFKRKAILDKKFIDFPSAFCSDAATVIALAENGVATTEKMLFNFRISSIHLSSSQKHLDKKLEANTQFYQWLLNLRYTSPSEPLDLFYYRSNSSHYIQDKCTYDYYNQVIKFLPWYRVFAINRCTLLSKKDKLVMSVRFIVNKLFKRG